MKLFKNILSPFPYTRGLVAESLSALRTCALATIILFFIRPFGLEEAATTTILGFGVVVFLSALLNIVATLFVFRRFIDEEKWCVWKEVVRVLIYLSLNVLATLLVANYTLTIQLDAIMVFKFIGFTVLFSIMPVSIRTISVKNWLLKQRLKEAQELAIIIDEKSPENNSLDEIVLKSNIVNDAFVTNSNDLLFIEAEKNYVTIVSNKKGKVHKTLLRLSLVKAQEQITSDAIIRCHRSFLININAVSKVRGNSQGLKLVLSDELPPVPVSRSYKEKVVKKINIFNSN